MSRATTSRDVAARAGVSQTAVSIVFTGRAGVSPATAERVLAAAKELNYRPNIAARSMRTRRSGRLAVVMPLSNWHFADVLAGAAAVADENGYALEVQNMDPVAPSDANRLVDIVGSGQYEGVLSFSPLPANALPSSDCGTTVVSLDEFDQELHVTGTLTDAAPLVTMMETLASWGHRRFLHVAGASEFASARSRKAAYLATIDRLGLESLGVFDGDWSGESGRVTIASLTPDAPPFAAIAANDVIATGVVRGAHERGWTVPGDVSVTGWDDLPTTAYQTPSLTTVFADRPELGRRSMLHLIRAIRGETQPESTPSSLQSIRWRESTAPPN